MGDANNFERFCFPLLKVFLVVGKYCSTTIFKQIFERSCEMEIQILKAGVYFNTAKPLGGKKGVILSFFYADYLSWLHFLFIAIVKTKCKLHN